MADDDDDEMKTGECKITDLSCIRLHHSQNHTVFSQPLSETTVKNEQSLPPTGDEAPVLPEEVLFDILLRIPVRSLLQLIWGRPRHPIVEPLFVSKDGVLLLRTMRSELVLCNLNNGGVDYPRTSGILGTGRELHIYYESLVSPF